jgi:hypothetical protein
MGNSLLVDDHGHSALAVLGSRAVDPHGHVVGHSDHEGGNVLSARCDVRVSGEETGRVGVLADGSARVVEVGLHNAVVAGAELELDHVARLGGDPIGGEDIAITRNRDDVDVHRGTVLSGDNAQEGGNSSC